MADSLLFDGSDDVINCTPGDIVGTGAVTYAAVFKRGGLFWDVMLHYNALGGGEGFMVRSDTNQLAYVRAGTRSSSTFTILAADGWVLVAFTKPSGSNAGRLHKYVYSTDTWTHQPGDTAIGSPPAPTVVHLGANPTDGDFMNACSCVLIAVWDSELSDGALEAIEAPSLAAWVSADPKELWRLDRLTTITSLTGTSVESSRTGTTLDTGDAPAGWSDTLGPTVAPPISPDVSEFPKFILAGRSPV